MAGPLHGMTVIEMAGIGPVPLAAMLLADMGARVIRIDRKPTLTADPLQAMMAADGVIDRGRESIAVNLKDPRGAALVVDLVEKADVLLEGYRPGVMEKLGLGPQDCQARKPSLVYGRMTGWGQAGPLAQAAGHDLNYIALTGALHAMGYGDRPPTPPLNLVGDYGGGGMLLALGTLAALLEARQSGRGQVVDCAMSDGAATLMAGIYGLMAKGHWSDQRGTNFLDGSAPFYSCYECADGKYVSIGAIEPQFYALLLQRCGIADPQFQGQWDRSQWPELRTKLANLFRSRTRDDWCSVLEGSDACFAPVLAMSEAANHPHNRARGTFVPAGPDSWQPGPAPRFDRTPNDLPPPAPAIGSDALEVLGLLGIGREGLRDLYDAGIVYLPLPRG